MIRLSRTIGIIVFSLGLEDIEPSKCNVRAGKSAVRLFRKEHAKGNTVEVVSQWEPVPILQQGGIEPAVVVGPNPDASYLSGDHVFRVAIDHLQKKGITEIILVVHPLAWPFTWLRAKLAGFKVLWRWPGWIGSNRHSKQWQDRSAILLLVYGLIQILRGRAIRGKS